MLEFVFVALAAGRVSLPVIWTCYPELLWALPETIILSTCLLPVMCLSLNLSTCLLPLMILISYLSTCPFTSDVTFLSFIVCLPMMSITKLYYVMPVIKECDSELAYTRFLLTLLCGQLTTHSSMPCMSFITYSEVLFWPMMTKNVWDGYTVFLCHSSHLKEP
jgi:hypothetical protein